LQCNTEYEKARREAVNGCPETLMGSKLNQYLSLASFLEAQKEKYFLVRYSPTLESLCTIDASSLVNWRYLVLANDFEGIGVDKGFVKTRSPYAFFEASSPYQAEKITEDTLEEEYSSITVFALNRNSEERLRRFLQTNDIPSVGNLLSDDEIFYQHRMREKIRFF
jgi:hypothetical protein